MKLTLHIGLKKTATTTLQHALAEAKGPLLAAGLLFPGDPARHHRLARRARRQDWDLARESLDPLVAEARAAGVPQVLVSSEHFGSMPAEAVAGLRALLAQAFPDATDLRVLAYVREPVSFAASMCQQSLKNGVLRLADFHADPWPFAIADWLGGYCRAFGRDAVTVRHFHPAHLAGGDIVRDVLDAVGLAGVTIPVRIAQRNAGLTQDAVLVADALAALRPGPERDVERRAEYRRRLTKVPGGRFVLPRAVQEAVIVRSRADMDWLRSEFGLDIRPELVGEVTKPSLSPEDAQVVAQAILWKVEG
jgi:hypothetical protein